MVYTIYKVYTIHPQFTDIDTARTVCRVHKGGQDGHQGIDYSTYIRSRIYRNDLRNPFTFLGVGRNGDAFVLWILSGIGYEVEVGGIDAQDRLDSLRPRKYRPTKNPSGNYTASDF